MKVMVPTFSIRVAEMPVFQQQGLWICKFIWQKPCHNFLEKHAIIRKLVLNIHWKDWCWSWNSNTLATWWEELPHLKRPWFWERLKAGGKGDNRGWDGWMASLTQWTWIWVNSGSWWWTGRPGVLQSMGSQRVGQDWATELNWCIRQRVNKICT